MTKHSSAYDDIMGRPPSKLVKIGTTVALLAFAGILAVMWSVSYPDKVKGQVRMTTKIPPISVISKVTGYVELYKTEGEEVNRGELLGTIRNPAEPADVAELESIVINLMEFNKEDYLDYVPVQTLSLGEIQPAFDRFNETIGDFLLVENDRSDENKKQAIRNQRRKYEESIAFINDQIKALREEKAIALNTEKVRAQKKYNSDGDITQYNSVLEKIKRIEREIKEKEANREAFRRDITESNLSIMGEDIKVRTGSKIKLNDIKKQLNNLKNAVDAWKNKYYILSPADGTVTYYNAQVKESLIKENEEVMAILPDHSDNDIVATMQIPLIGSGRVEEGQKVQIKFDTYPALEYGYVVGRVAKKSKLTETKKIKNDAEEIIKEQEMYNLIVELPAGMSTTRSKKIDFRQGMPAVGEIITEETRLLYRVFGKVFE